MEHNLLTGSFKYIGINFFWGIAALVSSSFLEIATAWLFGRLIEKNLARIQTASILSALLKVVIFSILFTFAYESSSSQGILFLVIFLFSGWLVKILLVKSNWLKNR